MMRDSVYQHLLEAIDLSVSDATTNLGGEQFKLLVGHLEAMLLDEGVHGGDVVPLVCEPTVVSVAAIFALGMIGAAYAPVSKHAPASRQRFVIDNLGAKRVLTDDATLLTGSNAHYILLDDGLVDESAESAHDPVTYPVSPKSPAYVIYTSGTTGTPKGVMVSFESLEAFLRALDAMAPFGRGDRYLLSTELQFDVSVSEIFGWVHDGGGLYIASAVQAKDVGHLPELIVERGVTHAATSPGVAGLWSERQVSNLSRSSLSHLMIAGEAFPSSLAISLGPLLSRAHVYNCYGPTETTVYVTYHELFPEDLKAPSIPIGRTLNGTRVHSYPSQRGTYACLAIFGTQVASGYWGDEERTSECFKIIGGERCYLTGDLVSTDKAGELLFHGREDRQLEINSIRLEPAEIEGAIIATRLVKRCYVLMVDGTLCCCYIRSDGWAASPSALRGALGSALPEYAIPRLWVRLDEFPLTLNGKVDLSALASEVRRYRKEMDGAESRTEPADELLAFLRKELDCPGLKEEDDFLDYGFDSLRLIGATIALEAFSGRHLPAGYLYDHPSASAVREDLDMARGETSSHLQPVAEKKENASRFGDGIVRVRLGSRLEDCCYDSSIFQRVYSTIGLDSFITHALDVSEDVPGTLSMTLLMDIVSYVEAMRTRLHKDGERLLSQVFSLEDVEVRPLDLRSKDKQGQAQAIDGLIKEEQKKILGHLCDGDLSGVLAFRLEEGRTHVVLTLHHCVSDGASNAILSTIFSLAQRGKLVDAPPHMRDYLSSLRLHSSTEEILAHPFTQRLASLPEEAYRLVDVDVLRGTLVMQLPDNMSLDQLLMMCANEVTKRYLAAASTSVVCFQMLFNFRQIDGRTFDLLVNDCHETMTYFREAGVSDLDFMNRLFGHLSSFHYGEGHSTGHAIYSLFPKMTKGQMRLQEIYERAPLNIDFMGEVDAGDLEETLESVEALHSTLRNLKKQIRFTAFRCQDKLYILQVSHI